MPLPSVPGTNIPVACANAQLETARRDRTRTYSHALAPINASEGTTPVQHIIMPFTVIPAKADSWVLEAHRASIRNIETIAPALGTFAFAFPQLEAARVFAAIRHLERATSIDLVIAPLSLVLIA